MIEDSDSWLIELLNPKIASTTKNKEPELVSELARFSNVWE